MDLTSMLGGKMKEKEQKQPALEYKAQVDSKLMCGEVMLTIGEDSLTVASLFDIIEVSFFKITAISIDSFIINIKSIDGDYALSRMGQWTRPFYDALWDAYNKAVLRSLFIKGDPILTAVGNFLYTENGFSVCGNAPIHVYDNCVAILPPDCSARRIPLCFVIEMVKGDYELTLKLDTDESYTLSRLGYETENLAQAIQKQIRELREKTLEAVKDIDLSMNSAQIAKIMPEGAAASFGRLAEISTSFAAALEEKLDSTRAAESYKVFRELCDPAQIYIGFKKNKTGSEISAQDDYLLWLTAPSPDGQYAAVEFAEADSATFIYRTCGNFNTFARRLNRALEAISFKREVIRMSEQELFKPDNTDYFMASQRTAALKFIRENFAGRVIHSGIDAWKSSLFELWGIS